MASLSIFINYIYPRLSMNSMDPGFANRIGFLFANSWKASVIIYTNASPAMVFFTQSSNLPISMTWYHGKWHLWRAYLSIIFFRRGVGEILTSVIFRLKLCYWKLVVSNNTICKYCLYFALQQIILPSEVTENWEDQPWIWDITLTTHTTHIFVGEKNVRNHTLLLLYLSWRALDFCVDRM